MHLLLKRTFGITADSLGRLFCDRKLRSQRYDIPQSPYGLAKSVIKMTRPFDRIIVFHPPAGAGVSFADLEAGDGEYRIGTCYCGASYFSHAERQGDHG